LVGAEEFVTRWTSHWEAFQGILFISVAILAPRGLAGAFNRLFPARSDKQT
jgi:ABC-type branched-subunit amino acid transport system permease subunit